MSREPDKVRCDECGWLGTKHEVDLVQDPRPLPNCTADTWSVCPVCRTPEDIRIVCDEPRCTNEATCGTPTDEGYRWTCGQHRPGNRILRVNH